MSTNNDQWQTYFGSGIALGLITFGVLGGIGHSDSFVGGATPSTVLAGASLLVGGFLGFLFGIPRSKQGLPSPSAKDGFNGREFDQNTNLEQVSDWLTKIIVGVTLVQFSTIASALEGFAKGIGPSIFYFNGSADVATNLTISAILMFSIAGFLYVYLWTRIHLEGELARTYASLQREIEGIFSEQQLVQSETDSQAIELVDDYLDSRSDPIAERFANIEEVVANSSLVAHTLIFERARKIRKANWKDNKELVARSARVFRGLIKRRPDHNHRNYGQLGYALKDQTQPDWAGAAKALRTAIQMRGGSRDSGYAFYEFNLAVCLINSDADFLAKKASADPLRSEIVGLLNAGKIAIDLKTEPTIVDWAGLNGFAI